MPLSLDKKNQIVHVIRRPQHRPRVTCKVCFDLVNPLELEAHLRRRHQRSVDLYFEDLHSWKSGRVFKRTCGCGKEKKFENLREGFQKFCSKSCESGSKNRKTKKQLAAENAGRALENERTALEHVKLLRKNGTFKHVELDGREFRVMGWEHLFLRDLRLFALEKEDVATSVPRTIWRSRSDRDEVRRYKPDFFIPRLSLLVEVKSVWTFKAGSTQAKKKIWYARRQGYNVLLVIYKSLEDKDPIQMWYKSIVSSAEKAS